jgi:hypothetical protein
MSQLTEERAAIYGGRNHTGDIYFLSHLRDEALCVGKLINSLLPLKPKKISFLIDDRTKDKTVEIIEGFQQEHPGLIEYEYFKWCLDFSYPKNILKQKVPIGAWAFIVGGDMEIPTESVAPILKFAENPLNALGYFDVIDTPGETNDQHPAQRGRYLMWRAHPMIKWEWNVHEELYLSFYRLFSSVVTFGAEYYSRPDFIATVWHHDLKVTEPGAWWHKRCGYTIDFEIRTTINQRGKIKRPDGVEVPLNHDYEGISAVLAAYPEHAGMTAEEAREYQIEQLKTGRLTYGVLERYDMFLNRENPHDPYGF